MSRYLCESIASETDRPGPQLLGVQVGVDSVAHRPEHKLRRPVGEDFAEAPALHLTVANLAEKSGEPLELLVEVFGGRPVEQLAEHANRAAQPADRHPGVVDRILSAPQPHVAVEDGVDLTGHICGERPRRGALDIRVSERAAMAWASFDGYRDGRAPALLSRLANRRASDRASDPNSTSISRHASSWCSTDAWTWSSAISAHTR